MAFLTFDLFISGYVLIILYYVGALVCPFVMWRCMRWIISKFSLIEEGYLQGKGLLSRTLPLKQKIKIIFLFSIAFIMAEVFWRMAFEFMIGYIQMHDALVK